MKQQLVLAVGEVVVYGAHGVGRVVEARPAAGDAEELVVLQFEEGLRVTLPIERARASVRPVASEAQLQAVQRTLRGGGRAPEQGSWAQRHRALQLKLSAGELIGVAEIVRDCVQRQRAQGGRGGAALAPGQRTLYLRARRLLATEIAAARGIELVEADDWISAQSAA